MDTALPSFNFGKPTASYFLESMSCHAKSAFRWQQLVGVWQSRKVVQHLLAERQINNNRRGHSHQEPETVAGRLFRQITFTVRSIAPLLSWSDIVD
jgi:hypothetical protein